MPTLAARSTLASARDEFAGGRGYLAACTVGLPTRSSRAALIADLDAAFGGRPDPAGYSGAVERTRAHFAALVGVDAGRVAIGSQASVAAALIAASLPEGSEVLLPECEFSSIVLPFVHAGRDLRVRAVPLEALAESISPETALVAFSIVQSATGAVADAAAIVAAARRAGARTLCDATQAVGWLPVAASDFDAVICHAYKWLCAPRGVSFLTVSDRLAAELPPLFAGWYAGDDPWTSCYGHDVDLASNARRFDVSPAWQAFVGAEPALALFAALDPHELHDHAAGLGASFRERMGLAAPQRASAIVTWADPDGCDLARLTTAGIIASGRAGRARVAFHVFNDDEDVELALAALGR
ncbi:aminotransferase class V-fold PLP-dependent enzyme [Microbacterium sp. P5_E9]